MANYTATPSQIYDTNGNLINNPQIQDTNISNTPINTSLLNSNQNPINYVNPNKDFYSPASSVDSSVPTPPPPQTLSQPEQGVSDLIKQITDLQNTSIGKTTFTTEQEKLQGKPEILKAQEDISSQILMLQAKEKNVEDEMQKQSEGRGITAGGLQPLATAAKRDLSIQANILSAQLLATQGKLSSAQARVDEAVKAKFGPQEEEITAKLKNLELLLKDPSITLAEKNRANAQALLLENQKTKVAEEKQKQTDIWNVSKDVATNIANFTPTAQYPVANAALQAIQNAKTKEIAQQIAVDTGLTKSTQTSTVLGLIKTYPDAGILPTDSAEIAAQKASTSFSFASKNNTVRAIADPITGQITYYYSKGGTGGLPPTGETPSPIQGGTPPNKTGIDAVHPLIKSAVETVLGQSYIDLGKLRDSEKALAAQSSNTSGFPLLSSGDSDKIQAANQTYQSASTLIQQLSNLTKDVITAPNSRTQMAIQATKLNAIEFAPVLSKDNKAKEFIAARKSLLSLITRAAGEKGTLTDTDVNRIANALPSYGDNAELANQKAQNLDNVVKSVFSGSISAYIGSATQNQIGTNSGILKSPDGTKQVKLSDLTPAQQKEAKDAGWQ